MQRILSVAKTKSVRDYAMILLSYRHGLRASEVCSLRTNEFELQARRMICRRLKGSVSNWQQLDPDEVSAVQSWLEERPETGDGILFVSSTGRRLSRFQFYRRFRRHAIEAGVPPEKCHPHSLKHSLGTHLANAGVPVQVIQQRLGHRCIQNTMVYLAISSRYVDNAVTSAIKAGDVV